MPGGTIRAALIEDHPDVREGLKSLIDGAPGFECVSAFATMEDALEQMAGDLPDVILTDIGLPGMSGIEGIRIFRERDKTIPIVALTVYDDDDAVFDALCAGASGYLLKNTPP